jgi:hypothetical protein
LHKAEWEEKNPLFYTPPLLPLYLDPIMALSMAPSMLAFAPVMPALRAPTPAMDVRMETIADLETLAVKLNPAVGALSRRCGSCGSRRGEWA